MLSIINVIRSSSYYKTVRKITFLGCLGAEEGGGGRAACRVVCGLRRLRYSARWGSGLADSWSRRRLRLAATCECLRAAHLNAANTTYSHQLWRLHIRLITDNVVGHTFNSSISCKDENNLAIKHAHHLIIIVKSLLLSRLHTLARQQSTVAPYSCLITVCNVQNIMKRLRCL